MATPRVSPPSSYIANHKPPPPPQQQQPQDMSGTEAAERYGDRLRGAPAVVNAGRRRSSKSGEEARCTIAAAPEGTGIVPPRRNGRRGGDGCESMSNDDDDDDDGTTLQTPRMGDAATCDKGSDAATCDKGSTPAAVGERSRAREAAASANTSGGEAATGAAGRSGLYRPRTSGRGVGGSLRRRYSQEQVRECAGTSRDVSRRVSPPRGCASGRLFLVPF